MILVGRESGTPRVLGLLLARLILVVVMAIAIGSVTIGLLLPALQLSDPLLHHAVKSLLVCRYLLM